MKKSKWMKDPDVEEYRDIIKILFFRCAFIHYDSSFFISYV